MSFMSGYSVTTLVMKRRFRSTPETVFDAFLKPDFMKKWFLTRELTNKAVSNEPFVGGKSQVVLELQETFWSKCYGKVIDKFGIE